MRSGSQFRVVVLFLLGISSLNFAPVVAQHPPAIGYIYPAAVPSGQTTEVVLGGYDWTPDIQVFVHDPRIRVELIGKPGPILVPEPPYWFGKKSRRAPFLLPRETAARITVPADVRPGLVRWQAANANGATTVGHFAVTACTSVVEDHASASEASALAASPANSTVLTLPVSVSGQIRHIQEVDHHRFHVAEAGPVSCFLNARKLGLDLNAVLEIRDASGRLIADSADTAGNDLSLTFAAQDDQTYTATVYDLDFRGNRAFVYQLLMTSGPRVVSCIPCVGTRGTTQEVTFVGYGVASGQSVLESVRRTVTFPGDAEQTEIQYQLETPFGNAQPMTIPLSDVPQMTEDIRTLSLPSGITGVLDQQFASDRYRVAGIKGQLWSIVASGKVAGSLVDPVITVFDAEGKELARNDDHTASTDAMLEFKVPADGVYHIDVSDVASISGSSAAIYHLSVAEAKSGFVLSVPERLNVPQGGKAALSVKVERQGGFQDAIDVVVSGLPAGVTVADNLQIPAKKNALSIELNSAGDVAAAAALIRVSGSAAVASDTKSAATAEKSAAEVSEAAGLLNEAEVDAETPIIRNSAVPVLVATTIKPPFSIDAEGQDDVTKWPRGTTFPAPVLIQRDEGFTTDIVLEMTSRQGRHRQGIFGPELIVKDGIQRILYPVFLPEWLETTRTSRMVVNGVARVKDVDGSIRYSVSRQKTRMGFLPTGALLKLSAETSEFVSGPDQVFEVPLNIDRAVALTEPVSVELQSNDLQRPLFTAEKLQLNPETQQATLPITVAKTAADSSTDTANITGEHRLKIRATLLKDGSLPVISETDVVVQISPPALK